MEEYGLYVVNTDSEIWMGDRKKRPSNLVLAFASDDILGGISYSQGRDTWGSNHFPISFNVKFV